MARSRKVWKPTKKVKAGRKAWTPERESKPVPALPPNKKQKKTKRVLADVSKLKAARLDHGWRFEEVQQARWLASGKDKAKGRRAVGERWTCDYAQRDGTAGCKSFVWEKKPEPGQYHAWDCPYWEQEGKDLQPF